MHRHHFFISLIILVAIGAAVFFTTNKGLYPVAIVDSKIIFAKDFRKVTESAFVFYSTAMEVYKKQELSDEDGEKLFNEIRRATLEKLIEQSIVGRELNSRLGGGVRALIDNRLKSVENDKLEEMAPRLYGLSAEEFKNMVLAPDAAAELLAKDFKSKNEDYTAWLSNAKKNASVTVLVSGVKWVEDRVEIKAGIVQW